MNRSVWKALVIGVLVAVGGAEWIARERLERASRSRVAAAAVAAGELRHRSEDIGFFEARAATDPESAMDRSRLAALYLQRAREGNDYQDYLRADSMARASLALRRARNDGALAVLTSALLAQHRFGEARDVAQQLVDLAPEEEAYRALLGETCMETGDYDCARRAFERVSVQSRASLAIAPRLARWAEVKGDTAGARRTFRAIMTAVKANADIPREQRAWFHLRAADLEMRQGRNERAETLLSDGLAVSPDDHRLLAGMARVAAAQGKWERAVQYGDRSIAIALDPGTLGLVSDAFAARGDTAKSAEYFAAMEAAVGMQPGSYHRAWSLFLLDRGQRVDEVLRAAESELVNRRDIYGYDLLAWALYKSGRPLDARRMIQRALAQGTQDALLMYHAGLIERAAGDTEAARGFLRRALAIAPSFEGSIVARATLDSMPRTLAVSRR